MKKYEYAFKVLPYKTFEGNRNMQILNQMGEEGWELVSVVQQNNNVDVLIEHIAYFKRVKL